MLASLPMYDLPGAQPITDRWWSGLADHFRQAGIDGVPARLARNPRPAWTDRQLLFSQTCGYPLINALSGQVSLVCTPAYGAPGCTGAQYSSVLVVPADLRADDLSEVRGGICAFNARDSQSGFNVLRRMVASLAAGRPFFREVIQTGSHRASLECVAEGRADVCALDAVTHALVARYHPDRLEGTRILQFSPQAPGLPYIAGPAVGPDVVARLRDGVYAALVDPALADVRDGLFITGAEFVPRVAYDDMAVMEREARGLGYPDLA